jgi:hypothetical protein
MKKIVITETQLKKIIEENKKDEIYFDTFSEAVGKAKSYAESKGYEIDEDDWWRKITTGSGRPKEGKTTRSSIGLIKNGKPQKKSLHIQVYNMGLSFKNNYELNYYIS